MKRLYLFLLALGAAVSAFAANPQKPESVTVMSYNVRNGKALDGTNSWQYRLEANIEMVKDMAPDVFGIQEAFDFQMAFFKDYLDGYKGVGVGRDDGKKKGEHAGIFYNTKTMKLLKWGSFWLSETPGKPTKGWDARYPRTATWALMKDKASGKQFFFVNTHLDHKGVKAREESLKLIVSRIASINPKGFPMVLVGDFNVTPDNPALKCLDSVMKSARDVAMKTDTDATFNAWGHKDKFSVIDYIYFDGFSSCPVFEVNRKPYCGRTFVSDHYPIRATLLF